MASREGHEILKDYLPELVMNLNREYIVLGGLSLTATAHFRRLLGQAPLKQLVPANSGAAALACAFC